MTADQILAVVRPEDLFPGSLEDAKRLYRQLSRVWHPDVAGGSTAVFSHISSLYQAAILKLEGGKWEGAAEVRLLDVSGVEYVLQTRTSKPFQLGQMLIGDHEVTYLVEPTHVKLFEKAQKISGFFPFHSDRMRTEVQRYLPTDVSAHRLADGRLALQVPKTPDLLLLRDVLTHLGPLDPKHVAWITSSLLNIACYLSWAQLVHHDISLDTYFISPEFHSGALLGGWWYVATRGKGVTLVPKRTFEVMPFHSKVARRASAQTDFELIKATARECLGGKKAPEPMNTWLNSVHNMDAADHYKDWTDVLRHTFGPRKFAVMSIDAETVYAHKRGVTHG